VALFTPLAVTVNEAPEVIQAGKVTPLQVGAGMGVGVGVGPPPQSLLPQAQSLLGGLAQRPQAMPVQVLAQLLGEEYSLQVPHPATGVGVGVGVGFTQQLPVSCWRVVVQDFSSAEISQAL